MLIGGGVITKESVMGNLSAQQRAKLKCCASCEWIYKESGDCPKCGYCSYGARYVHGDKAYKYNITQTPWINRKMSRYYGQLLDEVRSNNKEA